MTTSWYPRLVPAKWPLRITPDGQVLCDQGDCGEPLGGFGVTRCIRLGDFLDAVADHVASEHEGVGRD